MYETFRDRADAGRKLARELSKEMANGEVIVLGLPRGGVPVAVAVAAELDAPVDVIVVRKIGAPYNPELAVGSIAMGGVMVRNRWILDALGLDDEDLAPTIERERRELARREQAYRGDRPPPDLRGKIVVLVDDGAATGATMHAATVAVKNLAPERIIVALPTSSAAAANRLAEVADSVVALSTPEPFYAVGNYYLDFAQVSDDEVRELLTDASQDRARVSRDAK